MSENFKPFFYALWMIHPILAGGHRSAHGPPRPCCVNSNSSSPISSPSWLRFAVIFPAYVWRSYSAAFYLYWCMNAISVALRLPGNSRESSWTFSSFFHTLRDLGTVLFKWAGLVMLLVAGVVSVSTNSIGDAALDAGHRNLAALRSHHPGRNGPVPAFLCPLRGSLAAASIASASHWGLVLFCGYELILICSWVGNHLNGPTISMLNMARVQCQSCCCGLAMLRSSVRPATVLYRCCSLNAGSRASPIFIILLPADSLIPMFESMVDRALSRTPAAADLSCPVPSRGRIRIERAQPRLHPTASRES